MSNLDYIAEPLREHAVPVDSVSQDPSNVREHPEKNKEAVKSSLREFGQRQVLVAREGQRTIEAGNLRLECARELGWSHVAVIFVDDDDLEAARYAIADNRTTDLGEWNEDDLGDMLAALDDPPPGYTDDDVGELLDNLDGDDGVEGDPDDEVDRAEELREEWGTEQGQLWVLRCPESGREHRLLCGDSTDEWDVGRLFDGRCADSMVTDPPYGVDYSSKNEMLNRFDKGNRVQRDIEGDGGDEGEIGDLFVGFLGKAPLADYNTVYVFMQKNEIELSKAMGAADIYHSQTLVWVKNHHVLGRQDYNHQHENILYGWQDHHRHYSDEHRTTVLEYDRPKSSDDHPTEKPVPLLAQLVGDGTPAAGSVYDPFVGSGTTIVAAQNEKRTCYAMEIDPAYVAVTLDRCQKMGLEPELVD